MQFALARVSPATFSALASALLLAGFLAVVLRPRSVVRRPRLVLGLVALITAGSLWALVRLDPLGVRLTIDPSSEPLLPAHDPAQAIYDVAVRDFGDDEIFVIAMETDDGVFTVENLERLRRISGAIEHLAEVREVKSLIDVTYFHWDVAKQWIDVSPFVEKTPQDPEGLARLRKRALAEPLYRKTLVSSDGRVAALNVSFRKMTDREFIDARLDARVGEILDRERGPGVRFHVAGRPHVKTAVFHTMVDDLVFLVPLAIVTMSLVLAVTSGSVRGVLLPIGSVLIAVLWTLAAVALLEFPLTILTSLLAPTLIVVGSVYGVHVLARHAEDAAELGDSARAAERALEHLRLPVLVSGVTTAIGYGSLVISDVPAVFEYGAFSVLGVACVTLLSLTLVPAMAALLPPPRSAASGAERTRPKLTDRIERAVDAFAASVSSFSQRHATPVIALWGALSLASAVAVFSVVIDTDYLSFFDEDAPVRRDFDSVNHLLAGAVPLFVVLDGGTAGAFREPEQLRALELAQRRIDAIPGVTHTQSLVDTLRVLNRVTHEDDPSAERVPETRSGVAELLTMIPKSERSRLATTNQRRANLVVRTGEVGSAAVRNLAARLEDAVAGAALLPGTTALVTGNAILVSRSSDAIAWGQANSVGLAALSILVLLAVLLRSWKLGLIAMAPNAVPVLLFFGLLGAGLAPLSLPTSLIASVALGIAIDDTVHFLVRYREERVRGMSIEGALAVTSRQIGRPMITAALMLILGFLVIALSGFATLRQFGLLSAATMAICLATDLILLPALVTRFRA